MNVSKGKNTLINTKRIYLNSEDGEIIDDDAKQSLYYGSYRDNNITQLNRVKFNLEEANISCNDDEFLTIKLIKSNISNDFVVGNQKYINPTVSYDKLIPRPTESSQRKTRISNATEMDAKLAYSLAFPNGLSIQTTQPQWSGNMLRIEQELINTTKNIIYIDFSGTNPGTSGNYNFSGTGDASNTAYLYIAPLQTNNDATQIRNIIKAAMIAGFSGGLTDYNKTPIFVRDIFGKFYICVDEGANTWAQDYKLTFSNYDGYITSFNRLTLGTPYTGTTTNSTLYANLIGSNPILQLPNPMIEQQINNIYIACDIPTNTYASNKNYYTRGPLEHSAEQAINTTSGYWSLENPTTLNSIIGSMPLYRKPGSKYQYQENALGQTVDVSNYQYSYNYENVTTIGGDKPIGVKNLTEITISLYDEFLRRPTMLGAYWNVELEINTFSRLNNNN